MLKYFFSSYLVTILGLVAAFLWGEHVHAGTGLTCVFIAFVLAILEISLSFDNAVVNAMKLENMSEKWQRDWFGNGEKKEINEYLFDLLRANESQVFSLGNVFKQSDVPDDVLTRMVVIKKSR